MQVYKYLPKDSLFHKWLVSQSITEVPISYQLTSAMSAVGCLLKRNVWVDQVKWQVYPNLSLLLVGPSGIGKDVAIRAAGKIIHTFNNDLDIGGKTMETIVDQLLKLGDPAAEFIAAPEITAFLGGKDYQKSMVQELTDILSTGDSINVSLKSFAGGKRIIHHPTLTMMAGSTEEWLHKAMPEGSLEGGLFPRFLIVCEEYNNKHIPLLKYSITKEERTKAQEADVDFYEALYEVLDKFAVPQEITPNQDAIDCYTNWYYNRFKYFSKSTSAYANRSRDQVLRLAMLCAISRGHNWMDLQDMEFAAYLMNYVAATIDKATLPPTIDAQIAQKILSLLPATNAAIIKELSKRYTNRQIHDGLAILRESERICIGRDSLWYAVEEPNGGRDSYNIIVAPTLQNRELPQKKGHN